MYQSNDKSVIRLTTDSGDSFFAETYNTEFHTLSSDDNIIAFCKKHK